MGRRLLTSFTACLQAGLVVLSWPWVPYRLPPFERRPAGPPLGEPPPGHPERPARHAPPTAQERALWRDLGCTDETLPS